MKKDSKSCVCEVYFLLSSALSCIAKKKQFKNIAYTNDDSNDWINDLNCIKIALIESTLRLIGHKTSAFRSM